MTLKFEERPFSQASPEARLSARRGGHAEMMNVEVDGEMRRFGIRDGLEISTYDLALHAPFKRKVNAEPGLTIVFLLKANGHSFIRTPAPHSRLVKLTYEPRTALIIHSRIRLDGEYDLPAGTHFSGIEIRASADFLRRLDTANTFDRLDADHPLTIAGANSVWIGKFPVTQKIETLASHLLELGLGSRRDDLSMEARSLDLLTAAISVVREPLYSDKAKALRDSSELLKAKNLMLRNLERTWTIHDLAREVGLSEKRLKDGFRQQYGMPVYGFLQKSRMQEARIILARPGSTVTEAAMAVGYANPSRFAQLFAREYGTTPSAFKLAGVAMDAGRAVARDA